MSRAKAPVLPLRRLVPIVRRLRREKKIIAFTNGCFDLLHCGHLKVLDQVKAHADCLIVAVNSDPSVRRLKGPGRPIVPGFERARLLAGLKPVDYVTIFSEPTPSKLIRTLRPDVLAKGGDWETDQIVGSALVESYGGKVIVVPYLKGHSTTLILKRVQRVIDANLNRAREALRVCEEVARFVLEDAALTRRCQRLRYDLHRVSSAFPRLNLIRARDSREDVGRPAIRGRARTHRGVRDLVLANGKRVQEALRVLEEFTRLRTLPASSKLSNTLSQKLSALRFRAYSLEQDLLQRLSFVRHR